MKATTDKQRQVMTIIREYIQVHGYPPARQDLADLIGISKASVQKRVEGMIRKGLLTQKAGKFRTLTVV